MLPFESGPVTWSRNGYAVSTDRARLDIDAMHGFLTREAWWGADMDRPRLERAITGSLVFGLYEPDGAQVGFARVLSDGAFLAYLRDVFVAEAHRGRGLALWLSACACAHPDLALVRNWMLMAVGVDAIYAKLGFVPHPQGQYFMQRRLEPEAQQGSAAGGDGTPT
jgi:GNAT superfamily N-acetyltransferase